MEATSGAAPAGFFLSLLTESYAVRALLGSLVAVGFAAAATRGGWVRGARARRLVLLAPVVAAAAAGVASVLEAETYLPQVWVTSTGAATGQVLELLGELRVISAGRGLDLLVLGWTLVAAVLLTRRAVGAVVTRRLVRASRPLPEDSSLGQVAQRLARRMGTPAVDVRLLPGCPGGALTTQVRRPVVLVDPGLLLRLDAHEAEGLLAHEIAHVARRDTLLSWVVGVFSDLTFFLPTVHLAAGWLHREREESADELASAHTRRPGALASSILKVWESAPPAGTRLHACAAVPATLAWPRRALDPQEALSEGARIVAARVERLVAGAPSVGRTRQMVEVGLAALLILAASTATLVLPSWIATDLGASALAIGYVPPPADPVESPAFATFRALAPVTAPPTDLQGWERTNARPAAALAEPSSACPCVETAAQWQAGLPAGPPPAPQRMAWRSTNVPTWNVAPAPGSVSARPLLTLPEARPRVGFFVVGRADDE